MVLGVRNLSSRQGQETKSTKEFIVGHGIILLCTYIAAWTAEVSSEMCRKTAVLKDAKDSNVLALDSNPCTPFLVHQCLVRMLAAVCQIEIVLRDHAEDAGILL